MTDEDKKILNKYTKQYKKYFNYTKAINIDNFSKYVAADKNPYHLLYTKNQNNFLSETDLSFKL